MKKYIIILFLFLLINSLFFESNDSNSNFIYPTEFLNISSFYGYRELYGNINFHNGVDFLAPQNSSIYATQSGYVEYAAFLDGGFGNTIIISHSNDTRSMYCHISETFLVSVGDFVKRGELIAYVGPKILSNGISNGNTTGPHLHFSILKDNQYVNPLDILKNSYKD